MGDATMSEPGPASQQPNEPMDTAGPADARDIQAAQAEAPAQAGLQQQKSRVVRPGEKRSKKGKRRINSGGQPPALAPDDFVKIFPVPRHSEILHNGDWRPVALSTLEKAPQIELNETNTMATSKKGYRMVRANKGAYEGTWYYEATIVHLGETGHVRLGWSTRKGELQAPVGYDEYSFGYRDLEGTKVHKALREDYGEHFEQHDIIGCYLHLGKGGRPFEADKSDIVTYRGGLYLEEPKTLEERQPLNDSIVAFSRNGVWQGVAYTGIPEGSYYPAISIYTLPSQDEGASVSVEFGPDFRYPDSVPKELPAWAAVSTLAGERPQIPTQEQNGAGASGLGTALDGQGASHAAGQAGGTQQAPAASQQTPNTQLPEPASGAGVAEPMAS